MSIVVCTHLSGKELHRQEGVGTVVTSGSLGGVMVEYTGPERKRCVFDSRSRHNISHFHHLCNGILRQM